MKKKAIEPGIIFCKYVPSEITPIIGNTIPKKKCINSRYAKVKVNKKDYYGLIWDIDKNKKSGD